MATTLKHKDEIHLPIPPLKLSLEKVSKDELSILGQAKSLGIMSASTDTFDPEGLFSMEIFGDIGTPIRNNLFGYIDLNTSIMHPLIFQQVTRAKALYRNIMMGLVKAKFNKKTGQFEADPEGNTGFQFFMSKLKDLKLEKSGSVKRDILIEIMERHGAGVELKHLQVIPAGMREYTVDKVSGRSTEDEINDIYRRILSASNSIPPGMGTDASMDTLRYRLQQAVLDVFLYLSNITDGKKKLRNKKWAGTAVSYGTRNVISAFNIFSAKSDSPVALKANEAAAGLFQFLKGVMPLVPWHVRTKFMNQVFPDKDSDMILVDKKTLKKTLVKMVPKLYDKFMTFDGLEKVINGFKYPETRHKELTYGKYYLYLIHIEDKEVIILQDKDELPPGKDPSLLRGITLVEMLYLSTIELSKITPATITRYPAANEGSSYFAITKLITNTSPLVLKSKNTAGDTIYLPFYPEPGCKFYDSMSVHPSHLDALSGDHDGDALTMIFLMMKESRDEINRILKTANYYKSNDEGKMVYSAADLPSNLVVLHMTDPS